MTKKYSFKKVLTVALLAAILFVVTYPHFNKEDYGANDGGTNLSFGWKPTVDEHSCEQSDFGWPFIANRSNPQCGIMYINNFAEALDLAIIPVVYIPLAALIVYGIGFGKRKLIS
ncbi:MAG TPA: hypothetical protein VK712_00040 [Verrucomicrobiae bacterium]|jgi:hypothetical protein|nr:hypothetical protein [Verrucomicrobiae bacterium]